MKKTLQFLVVFVLLFFLIGCGANSAAEVLPLPRTPLPILTQTVIPTMTMRPTNSPIPTLMTTKLPSQILGRVFSENYHGQAVWVNESFGWEEKYLQHIRPYPGGTIHFDVSLPNGHGIGHAVISPANGTVSSIYSIGDAGFVVNIEITPPLYGSDIDKLAQWVGYQPNQVVATHFHFGHITPLLSIGELVQQGEPIGTIFDTVFQEKLAYVLILEFIDGKQYQFSPCEVQNTTEFCGKCAPNIPPDHKCP